MVEHKTAEAGSELAPAIVLDRVSLAFEDNILLDNLSLELEGGRCTCILGPSGCGKSTLLKIISGNTSIAYQGSIHFSPPQNGSNHTAWMSQNDLLLPWMKVVDNVLLGAKLRFEVDSSLREKARSLLEQAGLGEYHVSLPGVLSGGMRQRVALLRTLMEQRPVLLMDEPFSALDALTRIKLQNLTAALTRGKTILMVTHDPLEALRLGDRILVMAGTPGKIIASFEPGGTTPRDAGDTVLQEHYPRLLDILMAGQDGDVQFRNDRARESG